MDTINCIEKKNNQVSSDCWNEALWRWIMQEYNTQNFGLPSWKILLQAFALLDNTDLAKELALKHPGKCLQAAMKLSVKYNQLTCLGDMCMH